MDEEYKQQVEERNDLWWITDRYLSAALDMVSQQFINDDTIYPTREAFIQRAEYTLRQHCPVAYSYFFTQAKVESLPWGCIEIILNTVRKERPLFMAGVMKT